MNEKDIDKIFRDGLQNAVEPTFESDWENFEKALPSQGAGFFRRYFFVGLIGLIALSGMTYAVVTLSGNDDNRRYSERRTANDSTIETEKTNSSSSSANTLQEGTSKEQPSEKAMNETGESLNNAKYSDAGQSEVSQGSDASEVIQDSEKFNSEKNQNPHDMSVEGASEVNGKTDSENNSPGATNSIAKGNLKTSTAAAELSTTRQKQVNTPKNSSELAVNSEGTRILNSSSTDRDEIVDNTSNAVDRSKIELTALNSLDGLLPEIQNSDRNIESTAYLGGQKLKKFETLVFVGVEQNAVLKTSPLIGVMEQVHFSKWTVGLGIGLQRSGRLNWSQEAITTSYGFDKYESGMIVNTESIDLLIIPVKLGYHLNGASRIFAGFTPSILVNARQNIQVFIDGTPDPSQSETGYKYQTGAADFHSFISAGYGYDFSENWNVELGVNYGLKKWATSPQAPVGGVLRVNYIFR